MTTIEWTDETWNPTTGCDRISPGCDHCYALTMAARLKGMGSAKYQNDGDSRTSGPGFALTVHPDTLDAPMRWRKPRKVFVNSMSDLFHQDAPDEFIARVFAVMALTPHHTYQVLTKRPQRMADLLNLPGFVASVMSEILAIPGCTKDQRDAAWCWPLPNVWLGTSIENDRYTFRADHLRRTPAAVRFISAEPLLGPLPSLDLTGIDWLIVGGESGHRSRPIEPEWVRDLRDRSHSSEHPCAGACQGCGAGPDAACVPTCRCDEGEDCQASKRPAFFFKQWGGHTPKANGRELDGRTWDEYPTP